MWCGWPAPHPRSLPALPTGSGQLCQDTWEEASLPRQEEVVKGLTLLSRSFMDSASCH